MGKDVLKLLGGSIVVYFVMAACSAASGPGGSGSSSSGGSGSSGSGSSGSGSGIGDGSGSVIDALTDPVAEAAADPNQSGTRLKVRYYAGADGSKQSAGMRDSMLNVDCFFQAMSDGTTRCVPSQYAFVVAYADSACTQPLFYTVKGCSPPAYGTVVSSTPSCNAGAWHVFSVGSAFTGSSYYTSTGTMCTGPTPSSGLLNTYDIYTAGAEQPPTNFVQATLQTEP